MTLLPRSFAAFLAAACLGLPIPAPGATWPVPAAVPSVAAALDSAASGDTVLVACGTWPAVNLSVPSGVTIRGATGDPACVTLDGGGAGRILDCAGVAGVRLEALTLANGAAPSGGFFERAGGAIRCDASEITLTDCIVRDNRAAFGAGVAARASLLAIDGCRFEADSATSATAWAAGGGIWAQECEGTITDCVFERNAAFGASPPGDGGAVFAEECALVIADCTFAHNAAGAGAGALYSFFRDRSSLTRCTFTANDSPAGGAMYVENSYPFLRECVFTDNTARNGGALFLGERSGPRIVDCVFDGDAASPNAGGAIDCWISDPEIEGCTFRGTSAAARGGALAAHGDSEVSMTGCLVEGATAGPDGGALFLEDTASAVLTRCTVRGTASGGGALAVTESASLSLDACVVAFAAAGAAAACAGGGVIAASCTDVYGNAGGDWTGCLAPLAGVAGNFAADPLFCAGADDASVTIPDSPCLPANNACGVPVGAGQGGCGCPDAATILVPDDFPTIAAALAAASPGDIVGVCSGEWTGPFAARSGVHVIGVRADLARVVPDPLAPGAAVLRAAHVADSTVVADLTLDGRSLVPAVVAAESTSVGLRVRRAVVTGGQQWGVVNGPDSRVTLGGSLADACDLLANGPAGAAQVRNDNVVADSLDATHVHWGTQDFAAIVAAVQGKVRVCPITNAAHDAELCASLAAVGAPVAAGAGPVLTAAPNPARGSIRLAFAAPPGVSLRLAIHDVAGRLVREFRPGPAEGGRGQVVWDGRDSSDNPAAPGVYFARLEGGPAVLTRKLVIVR